MLTATTPTRPEIAVDHLAVDHLAAIAQHIATTPDRWVPLVRFDAEQRWYTRLSVADDHEVWLLSWLPGQRTGIHDHGGSAGAFAVAQGTLRETVAQPPGGANLDGAAVTLSRATVGAGRVRAFGGHHVHEIVNDTDTPAVSVHVYAPALSSMSRYRLEAGVLRLRVSERAGADW